ncbi:MAG: lipoprotein [Ferruginibacter sp.]|nr:lipoprotein [Ferruginibacter sp.]
MKNSLLILACFLMVSCRTSLETYYDKDAATKIEDYKTYSWLSLSDIRKEGNAAVYTELTDARIRAAADQELALKNMQLTTGNPDLLLHYHIVVEDKTATAAGKQNTYAHGEHVMPAIDAYQYRQGTLIIDLMDAKTNKQVWRGWATDVITAQMRKHPESHIRNAVKKILLQIKRNSD